MTKMHSAFVFVCHFVAFMMPSHLLAQRCTEPPVVLAQPNMTVALSPQGNAYLPADVFDEGSYADCDEVIFSVSKNGWQFSKDITFTCEDVAKPTQITFRASLLRHPSVYSDKRVNITVTEKENPKIICPSDVNIDCLPTDTNYDTYGTAIATDNCGTPSILQAVAKDLDANGNGKVYRTLVALDNAGNSAYCRQILTIQNDGFDKADLDLPLDYTTSACNPSTNPNAFPSKPINYSAPTLKKGNDCRAIHTSYTDQVFINSRSKNCFRILRTWEIEEISTPSNTIKKPVTLYHTQNITVEDREAPIFYASQTVEIAYIAGYNIRVPQPRITDCDDNLIITNDSPYSSKKGIDASGVYPLGSTIVTFLAEDGCGNASSFKMQVIVLDKSGPSVVCQSVVMSNFELVNTEAVAQIYAGEFDGGSYDDVTNYKALKFTIRKGKGGAAVPPTDKFLSFNCEETGKQSVEIWVTDQEGNSSYCVTFCDVQDNLRLCDAKKPTEATIAGKIRTPEGSGVPNVTINVLEKLSVQPAITTNSGTFTTPKFLLGARYTIAPKKDEDILAGLTTYDAILLSRHLNGIDPITSPYKLIAADVNRSGAITPTDLLELRKVLVGTNKSFTNNTSWRFVDAAYVFPDSTAPSQPSFPETARIRNLDTDKTGINFIAVKIGDINGSVNTIFAESRAASNFVLRANDKQLKAGEETTVYFEMSEQSQTAIGAQAVIKFDVAALDLSEKPTKADKFDFSQIHNGLLPMIWDEKLQNAGDLTKEKTVFALRFHAKRDVLLSEALQMDYDNRLKPEAYSMEGEVMPLKLTFAPLQEAVKSPEVLQNNPNPFKDHTVIPFYMPESAPVTWSFYDATGKMLYTEQIDYTKGYHQYTFETSNNIQGGLVFYTFSTPTFTTTKKMVLMK
jgi:Dockerin type I domain